MGTFQYGMLVEGITGTATSGGSTVLTLTSRQIQYFTGTLTQTVLLPNTTGMATGQFFEIYNLSTGVVTVQNQDGSSFTSNPTIQPNACLIVKLISVGTANGTWMVQTVPSLIPGPTNFTSNVGINTTNPGGNGTSTSFSANKRYLGIKGTTLGGVLSFTSGAADANNTIGQIEALDLNNVTDADQRVANIGLSSSGTTANRRGGSIIFQTKTDSASGLTTVMTMDRQQQANMAGGVAHFTQEKFSVLQALTTDVDAGGIMVKQTQSVNAPWTNNATALYGQIVRSITTSQTEGSATKAGSFAGMSFTIPTSQTLTATNNGAPVYSSMWIGGIGVSGGGTLTADLSGMYIQADAAATGPNKYAVYIDQYSGGTNNWGVYVVNNQNFLGGTTTIQQATSPRLDIKYTSNSGTNTAELRFLSNNVTFVGNYAAIVGQQVAGTDQHQLKFITSSTANPATEKMRISEIGRISVGEVIPLAADIISNSGTNSWFGITGNAANAYPFIVSQIGANTAAATMALYKTRTTTGQAGTSVASGDSLANLIFFGANSSSYVAGASIQVDIDGTPSTSTMPARIMFKTVISGSNSLVERVRIDNAGRMAMPLGNIDTTCLVTIDNGQNQAALSSTSQFGLSSFIGGTSAATATICGVSAAPATQAASFTCANMDAFLSRIFTKGAGSTITNATAYRGVVPTVGTNNAFIADNSNYTGQFFINSSSTNASTLAGSITSSFAGVAIISSASVNNSSQSLKAENTNTGAGSNAQLLLTTNSTHNFRMQKYCTNGTNSAQITGGLTGEIIQMFTDYSGGMTIGTNNAAAINIDTGQISTFGPNGIITPIILGGTSSNGQQIQLGTASSNGSVGTMFSSANAYLAGNALQTTYNSDQWTQPNTGANSAVVEVGGAGFKVFTVGSGHANGTKAAFWSTVCLHLDTAGNFCVGGTPSTNGKFEVFKSSTYNNEGTAGIAINTGTSGQPEIELGADNGNTISYIQSASRGTSFQTVPLVINPNGGKVGFNTIGPINAFNVNQGSNTTAGTASTYGIVLSNQSTVNTAWAVGSDATNVYMDTMSSKPFHINDGGNNVLICSGTGGGAVTIGTTTAANVTHTLQNNSTTTTGVRVLNASTSTSSDAIPAFTIQKGSTTNTAGTNRFIEFDINAGGTGSGYVATNGANNAAFAASSDSRLKENIVGLGSQLQNIMALKPSEFDYLDGSGHQIGFIAQEMQTVYPDVVSAGPDGMLSITGWSKTDARMVKALQELKNEHDALKADFDAYRAAHP